ncbi:MAG TPA: glycosyltransferase [Burkholderiales bacterium]|nr:glycosyltransferase [Burkholderiales bacterium]
MNTESRITTGKRIVLASYGTLGDLHPYLAIALELQNRGYRPLIATSEYHRRRIEAAGLEFHAIRPDIAFENRELHRRFTEPIRGLERVIREVMLPALRSTYDDLLTAVQRHGRADLLISHILMFAAPLVAETTGVRWVSTELQPGAFMSPYDPPVPASFPAMAGLRGWGSTFHAALFGLAKLTLRSWGTPVQQLRRQLGLPPGKNPLFDGRHSPHLVLALFSRELGERQRDWPANTIITGFPFYDEPGSSVAPTVAQFLSDGDPPIVFTLGSSAVWDAGNFYLESLAAAQKLGQRALLLVGHDPRNRPASSLPDTAMAVDYVPFAHVFPRASVIVHQGGIGTTGQALRAGKPMLVMPSGGDQYDNGARIERLGVGCTIKRKQYAAGRVAADIKQLRDGPHYRERAAALGQRVRAERGVIAACNAIEGQLDRS